MRDEIIRPPLLFSLASSEPVIVRPGLSYPYLSPIPPELKSGPSPGWLSGSFRLLVGQT